MSKWDLRNYEPGSTVVTEIDDGGDENLSNQPENGDDDSSNT